MRSPFAFLTTLLVVGPLSAQAPGDSVRVRFSASAGWTTGRLLQLTPDSIAVRQFHGDLRRSVAGATVQVYRRRNPALTIGLSAAAAGLGWATALLAGSGTEPFTGSDAGDLAVATGAGAAVGGLFLLISPGTWKRVRP